MLAGCGGVSVSILLFDEFPQDNARPVAFQKITPTIDSAISVPRLIVVRDLVTWDALWRDHSAGLSPVPPMPPINFAQQMVIGVFHGRPDYSCRGIEIQSVWEHSHPARLEVDYREVRQFPDDNGQCPYGIRNPADLIVLAYSHLPVEFVRIGG